MAQVTVKINGYAYTVGCEDGQEQHLVAMSEQVEGRIDSIKALGGNTGEARLLVLASLLMADELHDLRVELDTLRAAAPRAGARRPAPPGPASALAPEAKDTEAARRLAHLAARAEQLAATLEQPQA